MYFVKLEIKSFLKRFSLLLIFGFLNYISAHARPYVAPIAFLLPAKNVYRVDVTGVGNGNVTFTVREVLRGKPVTQLTLHPYMHNKYLLSSDWILASCAWGRDKQSVGLTINDDCGWIPMTVTRKDGQAFVMLGGERGMGLEDIRLDMASDGTEGLTLNHIRQLLQKSP